MKGGLSEWSGIPRSLVDALLNTTAIILRMLLHALNKRSIQSAIEHLFLLFDSLSVNDAAVQASISDDKALINA